VNGFLKLGASRRAVALSPWVETGKIKANIHCDLVIEQQAAHTSNMVNVHGSWKKPAAGRGGRVDAKTIPRYLLVRRGAPLHKETTMVDQEIGWIAAIIIGGIAGWLAERFMESDMGLLMNIVLGIVGAAIASAILSFFGIVLVGWVGYLIAGFIGACLLIWIVRIVRGRTA
jgi:uncharacterized membrane protein YeaQ/YmgE (transglycosylase-associated protein family)